MQCPVCSTVMEGDIKRKIYADFHCVNDACPSKAIDYCPHIEVMMIGDGKKVPWHCVSYHIPFKDWDDTWMIMEANEKNKETTLYERYSFLMSEKKFFEQDEFLTPGFITVKDAKTIWEMTMLISVNQFMPLHINDKIPETAKELFRSIKNLELFEDYAYSSYTGTGYYNHYPAPVAPPPALAISNDDDYSGDMGCCWD